MRDNDGFGAGVCIGIILTLIIILLISLAIRNNVNNYKYDLLSKQGYTSTKILRDLDDDFIFSGLDSKGQFVTGIYRENINQNQPGSVVISSVLPNPAQ